MMLNQIADNISNALFIMILAGIPLVAAFKKVKVYDAFIEGAKDSAQLIFKILPHMVAMLVAIGMFRASGGFEIIYSCIGPFLEKIGMPAPVVPLALIRPFSAAASNGILVDLIKQYGGDAPISHLAATMIGSTETTFYVIAVYFGVASIRRTRHAVPAGLIADFCGIVASLLVCRILLF